MLDSNLEQSRRVCTHPCVCCVRDYMRADFRSVHASRVPGGTPIGHGGDSNSVRLGINYNADFSIRAYFPYFTGRSRDASQDAFSVSLFVTEFVIGCT